MLVLGSEMSTAPGVARRTGGGEQRGRGVDGAGAHLAVGADAGDASNTLHRLHTASDWRDSSIGERHPESSPPCVCAGLMEVARRVGGARRGLGDHGGEGGGARAVTINVHSSCIHVRVRCTCLSIESRRHTEETYDTRVTAHQVQSMMCLAIRLGESHHEDLSV